MFHIGSRRLAEIGLPDSDNRGKYAQASISLLSTCHVSFVQQCLSNGHVDENSGQPMILRCTRLLSD